MAVESFPHIDILHVEKRLLFAALLLDVLPAADRVSAAAEWHYSHPALGPCGFEARLEEVDEAPRADVHALPGDAVADEDNAVTVADERGRFGGGQTGGGDAGQAEEHHDLVHVTSGGHSLGLAPAPCGFGGIEVDLSAEDYHARPSSAASVA